MDFNALIGRTVKHKKFGDGCIIEIDNSYVSVDFNGTRKAFQINALETYFSYNDEETQELIRKVLDEKKAADRKNRLQLFFEGRGTNIPIDALYEYAAAAKNGEFDELFKKYPLSRHDVKRYVCRKLAEYCEKKGDDEHLFRFSKMGAEYPGPDGWERDYANRFGDDFCLLYLARCYKDGRGTEKDLPLAARCYFEVTDKRGIEEPIWIEQEPYCFSDTELEDLYGKLKAESDAGKNYPGLHYALARMTCEGLGTVYDSEKYKEYVEREMKNYAGRGNEDKTSGYKELMENYSHENVRYHPIVKEVNTGDLQAGDVVRLGKYDYRELLWYVIGIEDDSALLLSTCCLEPGLFLKNQEYNNYNKKFNKKYKDYLHSPIRKFTAGLADRIFSKVVRSGRRFDYTKDLIPDKNGDYVFLISMDDIKRYNPDENVLSPQISYVICDVEKWTGWFARERPMLPLWWTSTDGAEGYLMSIYGRGHIRQTKISHDEAGIRPAIRVKLN